MEGLGGKGNRGGFNGQDNGRCNVNEVFDLLLNMVRVVWVLPPLMNSWIRSIVRLYRALSMTPIIDS